MQRNAKYYFLVKQIYKPFTEACIKIQAKFRGYSTKRLYKQTLLYERKYKSVKWTGGGREVAIVGDMTDPPWIARLGMDYCRLRHIFVKYFAKLRSGVYYYNYFVDGELKVSKDSPVIDHLGTVCNVLEVADTSAPKTVLSIPRAFSKDYTDEEKGWSELRRICSESSVELLKQQPAFQTGDVAESSGEYELLNALKYARTPEETSPKESENDRARIEEVKAQDAADEDAKKMPFGFKDVKEYEPMILKEIANLETTPTKSEQKKEGEAKEEEEEKSKPEDVKAHDDPIKPEDKFAGGRAEINFDLAYDYEQYYS